MLHEIQIFTTFMAEIREWRHQRRVFAILEENAQAVALSVVPSFLYIRFL